MKLKYLNFVLAIIISTFLVSCASTQQAKVEEPLIQKTEKLDSDGDGLIDTNDQCPNTPKGAKVNEQGCWELPNVQFDTGKYDIKVQYFSDIDEVVSIMEKNPSLNIEIQGHTYSTGDDSSNKTLSENRAKAVVEYLLNRGVRSDLLTFKGFGSSKPVALNETEEGKARNRRIELHPLN